MKKIVVIKLGSSVTTTHRDCVDTFRFEQFAQQIKQLHAHNVGVILVVSGAIVTGKKALSMASCPQAVYASVGQAYITAALHKIFLKHLLVVAQLLVTKDDFKKQERIVQIKTMLQAGIENNITMILNENDAIDTESFSGNDFLAAQVAVLLQASNLLLLTDVAGVYDKYMQVITNLQQDALSTIGSIQTKKSKCSVGGIQAKIQAARYARTAGVETVIAHGQTKNILQRLILQKEKIGTTII